MELSVIIPCHNGEGTLAVQLEALARQHWDRPWEIILVDNGSTDRSRDIADSFRLRLPHLRIIDAMERLGAAYARNMAVREARSEYLAFCDCDDEVSANWVPAMGIALRQHDFVFCRIDDQKLNPPAIKDLWGNTAAAGPPMFLGFMPAAAGCGFGITRRLYEKVGEFDESLPRLEDIDYSWRAQLAGFQIHYVADAVVYYRYRHNLKDMFQQRFGDGKGEVSLYRKYATHGMPWRSIKHAAADWIYALHTLPQTRTLEGRRLWVKHTGLLVGRLAGSVTHRAIAL